MNTGSNRQGGWVASFVIVGVILVAALLGSIYYLKHRESGQIATKDDSSQTTTDQSKSSDTLNDSNASSTDDKAASPNDDSQQQTDQSATTENDSSADTSTDSDKTTDSTSSTRSDDELPVTGPKETITNLVVVSLLSFAVASYIRSRKLAL